MKKIEIIEVGPRDGLQNEVRILPASTRSQFVKRLSQCGFKRIEVGAFVSPNWIPQMANSLQVSRSALKLKTNSKFSALVPNEKGMNDFLKAPLHEAALFAACSESFSKKNINCSIAESFLRFETIIKLAKKNKIKTRGYLSTVYGCPFEGSINPKIAVKLTKKFFGMGVDEVSLGDTIGVATPKQVSKLLSLMEKEGISFKKIAGHFHDTRGTALANVHESLRYGVSKFDSSVGGLGGCPYAPGASGNLATEDLIYMLHGMGYSTGVDLKKVIQAALWIQKEVGHPLMSRMSTAGIPKN